MAIQASLQSQFKRLEMLILSMLSRFPFNKPRCLTSISTSDFEWMGRSFSHLDIASQHD